MSAIAAPAPTVPDGARSLDTFVDAGLLSATPVQVAAALARLVPDTHPDVLLAAALAVRAPDHGHVCLDLSTAATLDVDDEGHPRGLTWPEISGWRAELAASELVATPSQAACSDAGTVAPLVLDGDRLYLARHWRDEVAIARRLREMAAARPHRLTDRQRAAADAALERLFPSGWTGELFPRGDPPGAGAGAAAGAGAPGTTAPADHAGDVDRQRVAAASALERGLVIIGGGPGTGKTRTVARTLAVLHAALGADGRPPAVALAAPTGKAAARMNQAIRAQIAEAGLSPTEADLLTRHEARTIHRLLGSTGGSRFRHGAGDPLPYDVVVVDEVSMVSVPLMARLLEAVRPGTQLVLVGDPFQLASVEAGAVLADLLLPLLAPSPPPADAPLRSSVTVLQRVHRFGAESDIARLADDVRAGDTPAVQARLLGRARGGVRWTDPADATALSDLEVLLHEHALALVAAARAGAADDALRLSTTLKVLCGTRHGPLGVARWNHRIEELLSGGASPVPVHRPWYVGRPVLVTRNDYLNRLFNGDHGVVVAADDGSGRPVVVFEGDGGPRLVDTTRLADVETQWAMTIHKSQGSELDHVVLALPDAPSPILSRELLYTGLTRARTDVTVVASLAALATATDTPIRRSSGLAARLWG